MAPLLPESLRMALNLTRQCAWCRRIADRSGRYRIETDEMIVSATHGICPECKEAARVERRPHVALALA